MNPVDNHPEHFSMAEDVFLEQFGGVSILHYTKNVLCIDVHDVREVYEHTNTQKGKINTITALFKPARKHVTHQQENTSSTSA